MNDIKNTLRKRKKVTVSFNTKNEIKELLLKTSQEYKISVSALITLILEQYFKNNE